MDTTTIAHLRDGKISETKLLKKKRERNSFNGSANISEMTVTALLCELIPRHSLYCTRLSSSHSFSSSIDHCKVSAIIHSSNGGYSFQKQPLLQHFSQVYILQKSVKRSSGVHFITHCFNSGAFDKNLEITMDHDPLYPSNGVFKKAQILCSSCHQNLVEKNWVLRASILFFLSSSSAISNNLLRYQQSNQHQNTRFTL